jgi:hypothetical protein
MSEAQAPKYQESGGQYSWDYYACPDCGATVCSYCDCPECGWYDAAAWEVAVEAAADEHDLVWTGEVTADA